MWKPYTNAAGAPVPSLIAGIHDMPAAQYHADPCPDPSLSASVGALLVGRSPLHAWAAHPKLGNEPREDKDVFDLGTAAHHMVLRQDFWREQIAIVDADAWTTKAAREQRDDARASGLTPLLRKHYERLERMVAALEKHPQAGRAFRDGKPERSLFWKDEEAGIWMRCRPDWLPNDTAAPVPDYKTTTDARPETWDRRFCLDHGGLLRAAHYEAGMRACGFKVPALYYVVQEVTPPHAVTVRVVEPESEVMRIGRALLAKAKAMWAECLRKNEWPGYMPLIGTVAIPDWSAKRLTVENAEWLGATAEPTFNQGG